MQAKPRSATAQPDTPATNVRASITFEGDTYNTLEEIARQKKVSLAWVVREAVEHYIAERWPLLVSPKER